MDQMFNDFVKQLEDLVGLDAHAKGYQAVEQMYTSLQLREGHALGEVVGKVARYRMKRNPHDLVKAAGHLFLLWRDAAMQYKGAVEE